MPQLMTPAQLINNLLANADARQRAQVLGLAKTANQRMLKQLQDEQLMSEENGWADDWTNRFNRTSETLAEIERALATC
jgi:uncharacterized membrane protein YccC